MKDKRKIAWLIIGGIILSGAIAGSISGRSQAVKGEKNFWQDVVSSGGDFSENVIEGSGIDKIAIIKIDGAIYDTSTSTSSLLSQESSMTAENIVKQIDVAEEDNNVKALILQVNSPGGTAVAGQTIMERLENFKKSGKKLFVSMREVAASAAYEISLPADKIFANPETQTGSIGVVLYLSNYEELYNKIGISSVVIKSGEMKDIGNPDRKMTDAEKNLLQGMVDESYNRFVSSVAAHRKIDTAKVKELGDGRIFTGSQAKENGLIDEIGNLPAVITEAKNQANLKEATIVEYVTSSWQGLIGNVLGNISIFNSSSIVNQKDVNSKLMHLWVP